MFSKYISNKEAVVHGLEAILTNTQKDSSMLLSFWRTMFVRCCEELVRLPENMSTAFLNINDMQSPRWREIFRTRKMYWLVARTELGNKKLDEVGGAITVHDSEAEFVNNPLDREKHPEKWKSIDEFCMGWPTSDKIEDTVQELITNGWKFDIILKNILRDGFNYEMIETYEEHWNTLTQTPEGRQHVEKRYNDYINLLMTNGVDPTIPARVLIWELCKLDGSYVSKMDDDLKLSLLKKHHFFAIKLNVLSKHHIFVNFKIKPNVKLLFKLIVKCILQNTDLHRDQQGKTESTDYYELTEPLCNLILLLASPKGSNIGAIATENNENSVVAKELLLSIYGEQLRKATPRSGSKEETTVNDWSQADIINIGNTLERLFEP